MGLFPFSAQSQLSHTERFVYIPVGLHFIRKLSSVSVIPSPPEIHRLIIIRAKDGMLALQKHFFRVASNNAFVLAPNADASLYFSDAPPAHAHWNDEDTLSLLNAGAVVVFFTMYRLTEPQPTTTLPSSLSYETRIKLRDESGLLQILKDLQVSLQPTVEPMRDIQLLAGQIHMQQLILFLIENVQREEASTDTRQAVKQAIAYIDRNYNSTITAQQLYRISGVAKWQFSPIFQELTGKKPLDYLLDVRLAHAKNRLLQTQDTLTQIARSVGFKDQSYFARKFKMVEGVTPRQYVENHSRHKQTTPNLSYNRVVAVGYSLGDLLFLGIKPIGADVKIIGQRTIYRDLVEQVHDIGLLGEPAKIKELAPDLIVHSGFRHDWIDELALIAPTVLIDRFEHVYKRIVQVAELFHKQEQAKAWVQRHQTAITQMWQGLGEKIGVQQTAAIFSIVEGNLYILGYKGFGVTAYHKQGFLPPAKVQELIDQHIPFQLISWEQSAGYVAEVHFILLDKHPQTLSNYQQWMSLAPWANIARHRIIVSDNKWNFDDPLTMDKLLLEFPQLVLKSLGKDIDDNLHTL